MFDSAESRALLFSTVAGLSTGVGGTVVFFVGNISARTMSFTLSLAGGVMTAVTYSFFPSHVARQLHQKPFTCRFQY